MIRRGPLVLLCMIFALNACAGSSLPGASGTRVPLEGASGMPAGAGLPAEGASGMPAGDLLACDLLDTPGQTDCSIAINIDIPPNGNPNTPGGLLPGFHPADLQAAYALPSSNSGGTVAIVDAYDDPTAEADLAVYRLAFGLPACSSSSGCFRRVNEQGSASGPFPAVNVRWDEEISLDLDMVSAACPNCSIVLVEANSPSIDDLGSSVDTAVKLGARAVSNSYYAAEWSTESSEDAHYNHRGVAITASTGDQPAAYYPAASPYVTAVGGTTLTLSNGSRTEAPWGPSGHGCSAFEAKPAWQKTSACTTRSSVDVVAVADPQSGVAMYDSAAGGWLVAGGTSVGAPIIAAAYVLGTPQGPSYAYGHKSAFHDIPPPGYDLPTGLGSPAGVGGL